MQRWTQFLFNGLLCYQRWDTISSLHRLGFRQISGLGTFSVNIIIMTFFHKCTKCGSKLCACDWRVDDISACRIWGWVGSQMSPDFIG